jgi:hypothetical protein
MAELDRTAVKHLLVGSFLDTSSTQVARVDAYLAQIAD